MSFFSWMFGGSTDEEHKVNNHHQSTTRTSSSLSVSVPTQQQQNQSIISSSSPQTQLAYMKRVIEAKHEQQQNQSQQQQTSKLVNNINPLTTWRDESDPHFVPFCFGHFHKSHHRRVCLTEEAAEVERRQREADMLQCHCALNLVDVINCSSSSNDQSSAITMNYSTSPRSPSSSAAPKNPYQRIKDSIEQQGLLAGSPRIPACRIHDIMNALPIRFREIQWKMIFASDVDGYSLGSLYRRVESNGVTGACLLLAEVVESSSSSSSTSQTSSSPSVIGAFLSDPPSLNHGPHHFYGSPETFVFSFDDDVNDDQDNNTFNLSSASASFADSTTSSNLPTPKRGAAGGTNFKNDPNDDSNNNQSRRARRESSSGIVHHHRHHRHHHSFRKSKGKLRTHHHNDKDPSAPPEHFLVCSPNHMGIGGGEDGAAILFVNDLQKGTSTANCASFNHCPPLVGQPRHGLAHSEFKVFRLYLFALDSSSDFIEYLIKTAHPASSSPSSSSSPTRKSNNNTNPNSIFDKYPCKGCEIQPRNHHKCNFIHDEFEKKIHPPVSATTTKAI